MANIDTRIDRQENFKRKKRLLRQIGQIVDSACYFNDDDERSLTEAIKKIHKLTSNETTKN